MQQRQFIGGIASLERYGLAARRQGARTVATIGSFDGVHLGHQHILERVVARAKRDNLQSAVVIFEPQPHEFFAKTLMRPRLMRLREKVSALFGAGVDKVLCLRFNAALRELTADAFIQKVLVQGLDVAHLDIGDDFRFGCDRKGDFQLLVSEGQKHDFTVANSATFLLNSDRVSSTRIREVLGNNDFSLAALLLGKPYAISGRVIYGRQLGRTINVPTANVGLGRYPAAVKGVYAVQIQLPDCSSHVCNDHTSNNVANRIDSNTDTDSRTDSNLFWGVANVGVKPTLGGKDRPVLEVHIFDYKGDLYGHTIKVVFLQFIREEKKFASFEALKKQIQQDCTAAKHIINSIKNDTNQQNPNFLLAH